MKPNRLQGFFWNSWKQLSLGKRTNCTPTMSNADYKRYPQICDGCSMDLICTGIAIHAERYIPPCRKWWEEWTKEHPQ